MLEHDGEQVFAGKALHYFRRLRRHRHRVAVVDDERLDFRAEIGRTLAQQVVADRAHVDRARLSGAEQVGALQRAAIDREPARRRQQQAAGAMPPGADEAGQDRDQAHRVAAAANALHAVVEADRCRSGRAVVTREAQHLFDPDTGKRVDTGRTIR